MESTPLQALKGPHELLNMETALLIATAASREIDVSVWFGEKSSEGKIPVREFDAKLMSLASAMGINQDIETKRELELATSTIALRMVHTVCSAGEDEYGQLIIDLSYFFKICQEKVDNYLREIDGNDGIEDDHNESTENLREWKEGEYDIHGNLIVLNANSNLSNQVGDLMPPEGLKSSKFDASHPNSASVGSVQDDSIKNNFHGSKVDSPTINTNLEEMKWSESKVTPYSPYDEEIEFADEEHDIEDELERFRRGAHDAKEHPSSSKNLEGIDWNAENRAFLQLTSNMPSKSDEMIKPRSSSAPRLGRNYPEPNQGKDVRSKSAERRTNFLSNKNYDKKQNGANTNKLPLTENQLDKLKDIVEDLVRETVKKTDCYHLVQVNLGYIESYTMIPPRGIIVQSQHREWITNREIHVAFIAGRLFLNDNQVIALKRLVAEFSKLYKVLYKDKVDQVIKIHDGLDEKVAGPVFGPNHTLSSDWLKKYLVHLRLTKRQSIDDGKNTQLKFLNTSSIGSKSALFEPSDSTATKVTYEDRLKPEVDSARKTPICWKEWLGKKLRQEMERGPTKPKDFQKALNGQNHPLSKDDIEYLLKTHHILPNEALQQEIEYRIESWVLDTDGRRDFQHQLNVRIRTWLWDEMIQKKTAKLPKDEHGYWRIWQSLPKEKRSAIKEDIVKKLVDEKREELKSSERTKHEITKQLYWQFDAARKEREVPWTDWLPSYLDKVRRNLDKFKKDEEERLKIASKQKQRRKSMASLQAIESNLRDVGKSLDSHRQMQLQKGIVSLRRAAQENGLGKGGIITREEFDVHIKKILAPIIPLDDTFIENHALDNNAEPTGLNDFAEEWRRKITSLFTPDPKETIHRVNEDQSKAKNSSKVSYQAWLKDKKREQEIQDRKLLEKREREEHDQAERKKRSDKAFKKWLKLRNQNKYRSRVDNKYHPIPVVKPADHTGRWNYEKDFVQDDNNNKTK